MSMLRKRIRLGAPLDEVRRALTDPGSMRVWLAEHAEVELPHRYAFWGRYTPEGDAPHQRLTRVDDRGLAFSWRLDGTDTTVEIHLDEDGPGATTLTLSQTGVTGWPELVTATGSLALMHTFWALALTNLVDHVEGREPTLCDLTSPDMVAHRHIDAPPHEVYESLADPDRFTRWFGSRIEVEPYVGGRWAMGDLDEEAARIIELAPGRRMSIEWPDGMVTTWELADSGGATRLTFVQSGFDEEHPPYGGWLGWLAGLAELRRYHELRDWRPMWVEVYVAGMPIWRS
ncbi:MAG: hypothetical protein V7603_6436 [Micromonosporaceae bacterium]